MLPIVITQTIVPHAIVISSQTICIFCNSSRRLVPNGAALSDLAAKDKKNYCDWSGPVVCALVYKPTLIRKLFPKASDQPRFR